MAALLRKVSVRDQNKGIFQAGLSRGSEKPQLHLVQAALDFGGRIAQAGGRNSLPGFQRGELRGIPGTSEQISLRARIPVQPWPLESVCWFFCMCI